MVTVGAYPRARNRHSLTFRRPAVAKATLKDKEECLIVPRGELYRIQIGMSGSCKPSPGSKEP